MRDPERIERILDSIKTAWKANPDLRFFQLIESLGISMDSSTWLVEDEYLESALERRQMGRS